MSAGDKNFNRRDFNKLTAAAFGGMLGAAMTGCDHASAVNDTKNVSSENKNAAAEDGRHLCRGINTCKNLGISKQNACAGQGDCATYKTHGCGTQNDCKGQGGCGPTPGLNACKGQGGCSVPLHSGTWEKVRARFEEQMKKAGKTFGAAPPAKKEG